MNTPAPSLNLEHGAERDCDTGQKTVIIDEKQDGALLSAPRVSWRSDSSDCDWHTAVEVPAEVLEACDGLDDAALSPIPPARRGRARAALRTFRGKKTRSSDQTRSSSSESSYDTASSSSDCSSHSSSCSCSSCISTSCSCSDSSCSCSDSSCSCNDSTCSCTSFESSDDLTDLPRAKTRDRRLGKCGSQKVADKCNQS